MNETNFVRKINLINKKFKKLLIGPNPCVTSIISGKRMLSAQFRAGNI